MTTKTMKRRFKADDKKLKELIVYICQESAGDERFSSTKLNKLLFLADFLSYLREGAPITGHEYQKLKHGPAPRALVPIRRELEQTDRLFVKPVTYHTRVQQRPFALDKANLDAFKAQEIALVDKLIRQFWHVNASEISIHSHKFQGWQLAEMNDSIPYEVALLARYEATSDEMGIAFKLEPLAKEILSA